MKPATIKRKVKALKSLIRHGVNLSNPEEVQRFLNEVNWSHGTKNIVVDSYNDFLEMKGFPLKLKAYRREHNLPFIPSEEEINQLISACSRKVAVFLMLLKETGVRPIEAWRLKFTDIDINTSTVKVKAAKYSRSRILKVSRQTLNNLLSLKRESEYVFSPSGREERFPEEIEHFSRNFCKQRKRIAEKLGNPRLLRISLKTFRHWKATMEYIRTKDIVHVKELLGHVCIQNTMKYVHIANAISQNQDRFICKAAKNSEEASKLIEAGFEYVCTTPEGIMLFRKPK